MLKVLFFAQLRDVLDLNELNVKQNCADVRQLRMYLQQKDEIWQEYLATGKALVAVNQTLVSDEHPLKDGDEVAFFPPVTGG